MLMSPSYLSVCLLSSPFLHRTEPTNSSSTNVTNIVPPRDFLFQVVAMALVWKCIVLHCRTTLGGQHHFVQPRAYYTRPRYTTQIKRDLLLRRLIADYILRRKMPLVAAASCAVVVVVPPKLGARLARGGFF